MVRKLKLAYGDAHVDATLDGGPEPWQQDGYEIGYAKAPYGSMPIAMELQRFSGAANDPPVRKFVRDRILQPNIGASVDWSAFAPFVNPDSGGNIESIPVAGQPGLYLHGDGTSAALRDAILNQGVNKDFEVDLSWLAVSHVDEVVSITPDGRLVVADPELAWAMTLWANKLSPSATLTANSVTATMSQLVAPVNGFRSYNITTVAPEMDAVRSVVQTQLGTTSPIRNIAADPANVGSSTLDKAGGFVAFMDPRETTRDIQIRFTSATDYEVRWRTPGGAWRLDPTRGNIDRDCIFTDALVYLFPEHWNKGTTPAASGDIVRFEINRSATTISMPVLFHAERDPTTGAVLGAGALSVDHVNSLVTTLANGVRQVVTGRAYGPVVDRDGGGPVSAV